MASWNHDPIWTLIDLINNGKQIEPGDGFLASDMVKIVENLQYLYNKATINLENGIGDVLIQTTDSNQSFKVMTDGRAKVRSAPVEDDDVVRNKELEEKSFAYYSIEAETARDYSKGGKIDKMFKDILKRIETIENKLI